MKPQHILAVHLLNDLSGSPRVLSQALSALSENGFTVSLLTSEAEGGKSFLNELPIEKQFISYQWNKNKWKTLARFFGAQWQMFKSVMNHKPSTVVYVNTLLPFGAALAAKLTGKKVVYHLHEVQINNPLLDGLLKWTMKKTANLIISVSDYLTTKANIKDVAVTTLPNSVSDKFFQSYSEVDLEYDGLMLCNLKAYKGIYEYVALAKALPSQTFALVLNASSSEVEEWRQSIEIPSNLTLSSATTDVISWYLKSKVVLNLSRSNEWVETFGMTALEAMALGKPVIVPTIGGIAHLVEEGIQGFHVESADLERLKEKFLTLISNKSRYLTYSGNAIDRAAQYKPERFAEKITEIFHIL
ncbi:MAG: glycosyltransferase family 4 protein [Flexibacteraceae bacterium]